MANIGSFKKSGNEFQGEIVTLSVQTKGVRIAESAAKRPVVLAEGGQANGDCGQQVMAA